MIPECDLFSWNAFSLFSSQIFILFRLISDACRGEETRMRVIKVWERMAGDRGGRFWLPFQLQLGSNVHLLLCAVSFVSCRDVQVRELRIPMQL